KKEDDYYLVKTKEGNEYKTKYVVNAAGVYGDVIANLVNPNSHEIIERHGSIMIIDGNIGFELQSTLFPVPGAHTKGMAAIPACGGNIILGSTAEIQKDKEDTSFTKGQADHLFNSASRLVPELEKKHIIRVFAGLRPVEVNSDNDFVIEEDKDNEGFYNVIGIQSPGIASSFAIAEYTVNMIKDGKDFKEKKDYDKTRKPIIDFSELSTEDRKKLVEKDPKYANVICRCEIVPEAEILDAIRRPCGAKTVDGVKRRTRSGMGRCQGGFCESRIVEILAKELGKKPQEILKENKGSEILIGEE
ncbi:MAG TPA: FAD-dependent oxidoreductase, partial [Tissierellaceae bacterium]|nr:FAD-dependent oxidoreductase [Tissierellaceae bacterium]